MKVVSKKTIGARERAAFMRGYRAGLKTQAAINIKNDRLTKFTAAIMEAAMRGRWGSTDSKTGKHEQYTLRQIEDMAVESAQRLVQKLPFFKP